MIKNWTLALAAFALLVVGAELPASAQVQSRIVTTSCGDENYTVGRPASATMNSLGQDCVTGAGGGGSTSPWLPNNNFAQLAVTQATGNVVLPTGSAVVVYNTGAFPAYIKLGTSNAVTAAVTNDIVAAGAAVEFNTGTFTYLAAIADTGNSTNLTISGGSGIYAANGGGGGGGGGGGAVTAALGSYVDGALVTIGLKADAAWSSGSGTLIAIEKAIAGFASTIATNTGTIVTNTGTTATNTGTISTNTGTTNTNVGPPGSVACSTDTASCNLNQQMQRLAQRLSTVITTLGTPLQAGGNVVVTSSVLPTNASQETGGNLATIAGAVTASVVQSNTKQVNGVTTLAGAGATGTGSQRTTVAQDTTTVAGSAPGTAGTPSTNVVSVQGVGGGTVLPVSAASLPLPTGAATAANQTNVQGAAGTPVSTVISVQGNASGVPLPVTGTISASIGGFAPGGQFANLTATASSASVALPTGTNVAFQNVGTTAVSCTLGVGSATASANQNLVPAGGTVFLTVGSNTFGACIDQTGSASNLVVLSGGAGLGTALAGGSTGATSVTAAQGTAAAVGGAWPIEVTDGTNTAKVRAASSAPVAGDVALVVTQRPDSATIAGGLVGTAGTASANVVTVQGVTSMTPLKTDLSGTTVPLPTNAAQETGGNLATIAGAITSSVIQSNTKQVNGVTTLAGAGAVGTGAQRVAVGQDTTTIAGAAPGTAGSASANVLSVQGITSMTPLKVDLAGSTVPLPTGASTLAGQQSPTNTVSGSTNVTAQDAASTVTTGAYSQSVVTGAATAASTASVSGLAAEGNIAVQVTGTWTGTLSFEKSVDSGTTWTQEPVFPAGSVNVAVLTTTGNGVYRAATSNATNFRVRSTVSMTGTAAVVFTTGIGNASTFNASLPPNASLETGGNLATIAGAVTSSVIQSNTKQVNGVTTLAGAGAVGTGAQRVAVGQDTTTIAGSAPGTAGSASTNVVTVQGIAGGTAQPISAAALPLPSNAAQETGGNLATIAGAITSSVMQSNTKQVNGVTTLAGAGATGTGSQRVTVAQDTTTIAGAAPGTAGSASANVLSIQGVASMTPVNSNTAQVNGVTVLTGTGATGTGAQRVTIATDSATVAGSASLPAGTNLIGKTGIDQTTAGTTNAISLAQIGSTTTLAGNGTSGAGAQRVVVASDNTAFNVLAAPTPVTTGGLSVFFLQPTASDNHTVVKNGAGQVYSILVTNNSATINYLRFFNLGTGFNGCGSATGFVNQIAIPASTSGAGFVVDLSQGLAFATGISVCITSGYSQTDTTNATASAISLTIGYK